MLRRIGFRTLLAFLNLALYVGLMCSGSAKTSPPTLTTTQSTAANGGFSTRSNVVLALNVPALTTALILNAVVFHLGASSIFWLILPFVPLSWFTVGLWIDRRLGWVRRRRPKRTFIRDAVLVLICLMTTLVVIELVRSILKLRSSGTADLPWLDVGVCAWSAFLLTVLAGMFSARFFKKAEPASTQRTLGAD